jgi:hypothetical protein
VCACFTYLSDFSKKNIWSIPYQRKSEERESLLLDVEPLRPSFLPFFFTLKEKNLFRLESNFQGGRAGPTFAKAVEVTNVIVSKEKSFEKLNINFSLFTRLKTYLRKRIYEKSLMTTNNL